MTRQEQVYQDKIAWAMGTIEERDGYCLVGSQSEPTKHVVTVNEQLYSELCTCKAGKADQDCYHKIAVDRHYDDRRPAFHQGIEPRRFTYVEDGVEHEARRIDWDAIFAVPAEKRQTAPLYRPEGFSLLR